MLNRSVLLFCTSQRHYKGVNMKIITKRQGLYKLEEGTGKAKQGTTPHRKTSKRNMSAFMDKLNNMGNIGGGFTGDSEELQKKLIEKKKSENDLQKKLEESEAKVSEDTSDIISISKEKVEKIVPRSRSHSESTSSHAAVMRRPKATRRRRRPQSHRFFSSKAKTKTTPTTNKMGHNKTKTSPTGATKMVHTTTKQKTPPTGATKMIQTRKSLMHLEKKISNRDVKNSVIKPDNRPPPLPTSDPPTFGLSSDIIKISNDTTGETKASNASLISSESSDTVESKNEGKSSVESKNEGKSSVIEHKTIQARVSDTIIELNSEKIVPIADVIVNTPNLASSAIPNLNTTIHSSAIPNTTSNTKVHSIPNTTSNDTPAEIVLRKRLRGKDRNVVLEAEGCTELLANTRNTECGQHVVILWILVGSKSYTETYAVTTSGETVLVTRTPPEEWVNGPQDGEWVCLYTSR